MLSGRTPLLFLVSGVLVAVVAMRVLWTSSANPGTYMLSGEATYEGKPIPYGTLSLRPDAEAGNRGPASVVTIDRGHYRLSPERGHQGGSYIARIVATDGTRPESADVDNSLFAPIVIRLTLPPRDGKWDFHLTRSASDG
ncbi:hypothetical protein Pan216_53560 [Planctomycetes bacterium Pan216]|uniref:Carboxypeptidase regulatory-like domain-containing protein n=1 Tax=Kolteria novifilia TaxID=2527975 RepID=A0A518BBU8_9BACT|nr:hypothetical protein Pan216_53560 [Planctomycetes bacterium Pan216]